MADLLSFPNVTFELLPKRRADAGPRRRAGSGAAFGWLAPAEGSAEERTAAAAGNMPRQTAEPGVPPRPPGEDPERRAPGLTASHEPHRGGLSTFSTRRAVYNGRTMALRQTLRRLQAGFPAQAAGLQVGPLSVGFPRRALRFSLTNSYNPLLGVSRPRGELRLPTSMKTPRLLTAWSCRQIRRKRSGGRYYVQPNLSR